MVGGLSGVPTVLHFFVFQVNFIPEEDIKRGGVYNNIIKWVPREKRDFFLFPPNNNL